MNTFHRIAAACLTLALAATVHAQGSSLGWGQKSTPPQSATNPQGQLKIGIVGGISTNDSSAVPLRIGSDGIALFNLSSPDRTYPQPINLLNGVTNFAAGTCVNSDPGRSMLEYSKGTLMFSWSAADSDSVHFGVWVYGALSSTSATWYGISPVWAFGGLGVTNTVDSTILARTTPTTAVGERGIPASTTNWPNFIITRLKGSDRYHFNLEGVKGYWRFPFSAYKWATSPNGIAIPLADLGSDFQFPYIRVKIMNLDMAKTFNAGPVIDLWPRVN